MRNIGRTLAGIFNFIGYDNNFSKSIDSFYKNDKSYDVRSFGEKYINSKKYKRVKKNKRKRK
ncbi:hypothetical protein [Brachyspira pulli]|uniref:hypothetical protein n=1 Tax=Brachyspira pulli TaxID=310721 RepID=UPI003004D8CA